MPVQFSRRRAFSLLEVLFAVALFGAVVTFILSAQAGLMAGNRTAANMSQAMEIGRCRMSEVEERQLKLGFPEIEEKDSTTICCDDKEVPGFSCEWQVERVKLPEVTALGGDGGLSSLLGGGLGLSGSSGGAAVAGGIASAIGTSMPGALASPAGAVLSNPLGGAQLDFDAGLQAIGTSLQQSVGGGAGVQGILSLAFSIVYPSLKPVLEAAIRRITVVIHWKEGAIDRDFSLTQYVTNPSAVGLAAAMADAGAFGDAGNSISTGANPLGGGLRP
ncbi:MAG: prepilin-type N-terminal cleavage/methylation domain-containing protein [Polyangiaceae bacterium]|jgi:general secretion pathway protein I